jgi:hypothetical protein
MNNVNKIELGDIVSVDFHFSQYTLVAKGIVLSIPSATGDSWIIRDIEAEKLYYISEGCTITKNIKQ